MLCGGEGRKELRGDGRDSLTHTAQDGRGSSRGYSRAPERFPRRSEQGGPVSAPGASLGGEVGPGALGVLGRRRAASRAAVRGCRRAEGNGAGLRSFARASPSPGGRGTVLRRGQGEEGSSAPFSGPPLPAEGLLFAG
ncbi:uncharacterized protein LJ264_007611 [Porphyrio hochstetteri]